MRSALRFRSQQRRAFAGRNCANGPVRAMCSALLSALETMPRKTPFTRRSVLAGSVAASAALAARMLFPRPALAATTPASSTVDVAIVGAGAAGIAAARKIAAAGRR